MWLLIFVSVLILFGAGTLYLIRDLYRLEFMKKISNEKKWLRLFVSTLCILLAYVILTAAMDSVNAIIVMLILCIFRLLVDFGAYLYGKASKKEVKKWIPALLAIVLTGLYLSVGAYNAVNVVETTYDLATEKKLGTLKIAMIADAHISTLFDGEGFAEHLKDIQTENPDVLIIAGDFVDDDSKRVDVVESCKALGEMKCKYGVYYSPGNHDKGYFNSRDFSYDEMKKELESNGVKVLEDEAVLLDDRFYLIGRKDKSDGYGGVPRKPIERLVEELDASKYMVVIDHQPNDYQAEAESQVDLVLSGHTHGGQLIPATYAGEWMGMNDFTYGSTRRDKTDFIVTSGIGDWRIKFKTGCKSEFVIVSVRGKDFAVEAVAVDEIQEDSVPTEESDEADGVVDTSFDFTIDFAGDINFDAAVSVTKHMDTKENGILDCISPELIEEMNRADIMCLNNEFTYSERGEKLVGKKYCFRARPDRVENLKLLGVDIVKLANNHVYDYGKDAFLDTLAVLEGAGIEYMGAGANLAEATKPVYREIQGKTVAFVAASRGEKNIFTPQATENSPGILRCYDPSFFLEVIKEAKENADIVLAYVHWGTEYSTVLEDVQTETARLYLDAGADAVIGAHTHCLQGMEYYDGKPIFYSLGNFWFNNKTLDTMLLQLHFVGDGDNMQIVPKIFPAVQSGCETILAEGEERKRIFDALEEISIGVEIDEEGIVYPAVVDAE